MMMQSSYDLKHVSVLFGFLCTVLLVGRLLGSFWTLERTDNGPSETSGRTHCFILSISFLILSGSTSIFALSVCYLSIGFASASIRSLAVARKQYEKRMYKKPAVNVSIKLELLRVNIISLVVCSLLSGLLYNSNPEELLPAFKPCIVLALYFMLLFVAISYQQYSGGILSNRRGRKMEYVDGSSIVTSSYKNSSPLVTAVDTSDIIEANIQPPSWYIEAYDGDVQTARKYYTKRLIWRKTHDVENLHCRPQDHFDDILKYYPHALHGRSKD